MFPYLLHFIASLMTYEITFVLTEVTIYTYLTVLTEVTLNLFQWADLATNHCSSTKIINQPQAISIM